VLRFADRTIPSVLGDQQLAMRACR
jgi:hypothetical protein